MMIVLLQVVDSSWRRDSARPVTAGARRAVAVQQCGQVAVLGIQIAMLLTATALSVFMPRWGLR